MNGHVVKHTASIDPEYQIDDNPFQEWCHKCGVRVIAKCPSCQGWLRGKRISGAHIPSPTPDAFCLHCGKALPWTQSRLDAMLEIAKYTDSFSEEDFETLKDILPDLIRKDTLPTTELSIVKMKLLLTTYGPAFAESVQRVLFDVAMERTFKALFGIP